MEGRNNGKLTTLPVIVQVLTFHPVCLLLFTLKSPPVVVYILSRFLVKISWWGGDVVRTRSQKMQV